MKKLLYLFLKKDMIKKLSKKHGGQFIDDVMETFGMPTDMKNETRGKPTDMVKDDYSETLKSTEECKSTN